MRASQAIALGFPALRGACGQGYIGPWTLYSPGSLGLMHEYSTDVGLTSITLFSFCILKDFKLLTCTVFMCYQKEE